ncbi:protein NEDD1-like [Anoplophora glabripennis]|uniref:protein NEDD1-like n=1 Tax=Anoplophora glabripennis TaxID=217634 RepID=UPI0008743C0B|nr:protein NEDD1-like [Anoplophora glabripennis]
MFASVGSVLKLHTWSDNQLEQIATFNPKKSHGPDPKIISVSWCHDNSYIALLPEDSQPQIVSSKDKRNINLVHTINALKDVTAVTFKNHTKRNIALANKLGEIVIYDTKNRNINSKIACLPGFIKFLEYNYRDEQLAILGENVLSIFVEHEGMNGFIKEFQSETSTIIKYHPSIPNLIAVGSENGCVTLWDTDKEEKLSSYQKHSSSVTGIGFSRSQKMMVTTGMDNKICVLDNSSSDCLFKMSIHQAVTSVDISPDDFYIAAGLEDGCICIYDIRDPLKYLICAQVHNSSVNKISFEKGPVIVESLHDGHSLTTINGSDFCDNRKAEITNPEGKNNNNFEDNLKKELFKMVKTQMNYLETQLAEHCTKFQSFINKEFDSIHNAMGRWDVFNVGDTNEIVQAIDTTDVKSTKSVSTRKSTSY